MKKILLLSSIFAAGLTSAQNYFGSEFIGEGGFNTPSNVYKVNGKILYTGLLGSSLTGNFPIVHKGGNADGILASLSPTDGTIQWIKQFGGGADEVVMDVATDAAGNYYLTGYFMGAGSLALDADPGPNVYPLSVPSSFANRDIFIIKLDTNGDFLWAKQMSTPVGAANDDATSIELDSAGNIYLAGSFISVDFDPGPGNQLMNATGNSDAFIVKLDNDGNFVWVKTMGGTSNKRIVDMEIDANDDIYVTGRFQGTIDLNPDATLTDIRTTKGNYDTFVAKYTSSGDYVWGNSWGGSSVDTPEKLIVNGGKVYVAGEFSGNNVDMDPTAGTNLQSVAGGAGQDGYFSVFGTDGSYVSTYIVLGITSNGDEMRDIYVDGSGNIYLSGLFQNITVAGNNYTTAAANSDIYYLKLDSSLAFKGIYLIQGTNTQAAPLITQVSGDTFLGIGATRGATAFDYSKPTVTENPSTAQYYTFFSKFDFNETNLATGEVSGKSKISVYPNPAVSTVNLKSDNSISSVFIFSLDGKQVYNYKGTDVKTINVSMLTSGMYILQTTDNKGNSAQTKLLKK